MNSNDILIYRRSFDLKTKKIHYYCPVTTLDNLWFHFEKIVTKEQILELSNQTTEDKLDPNNYGDYFFLPTEIKLN